MTRRLLGVALACAALAACGPQQEGQGAADAAGDAPCAAVAAREPLPAQSVQLHVHGPYSEGLGSIESHAAEAQGVGVRTIWWSDHDTRIATWHHASRFGFDGWREPIDLGEPWRALAAFEDRREKWLRPPAAVATTRAAAATALAEFDAARFDSPPRSFRLAFENADDTFRGVVSGLEADQRLWVRPLRSGVVVHVAVWAEAAGPDARGFVELGLSEHPPPGGGEPEPHVVRYVLANGGAPERSGLVFSVPLAWKPGRWNHYALDVSADAARGFPESVPGDDALAGIAVGVEARRGARAAVRFDSLRLEQSSRGAAAFAEQRALIDEVAAGRPAVRQLQGVEISYGAPHLNEFTVDTVLHDYDAWLAGSGLLDAAGRLTDPEAFRRQLVRRVVDDAHRRGGLVSYNHMLGALVAGWGPPKRDPGEVLAELTHDRLFGADLLEVGYRHRGGRPLADHLWVWDQLALAGLLPIGVGTSDSHGGPTERWRTSPNNFVTWVYAPAREKAPLIEGLRAGRAFFGDPTRFAGTLDLAAPDGARMGHVVVGAAASACVTAQVTRAASGDALRFVSQGQVVATHPLVGADAAVAQRIALADPRPHAVRVELVDAKAEPKALSNPIVFAREAPPDVAPVRVRGAARAAE